MQKKILNDKNFVKFLDENEINYNVDDKGMIKVYEYLHLSSFDEISLTKLKSSRNIGANHAQFFSAPNLEISGTIDVRTATSLSVPKLESSGHIDARNVTTFVATNLKRSGEIHLPKDLAGQSQNGILFSDIIGPKDEVSMFNESKQMVTIGSKPLMTLKQAEKEICSMYPEGHEHHKEYMAFFNKCKPLTI